MSVRCDMNIQFAVKLSIDSVNVDTVFYDDFDSAYDYYNMINNSGGSKLLVAAMPIFVDLDKTVRGCS